MSSIRKAKKERKKKEERACAFNEALDALKTLRLGFSGYCGVEESVFTVKDDMVLRDYLPSFLKNPKLACEKEPFCKKEVFLKGLRALNLQEWKKRYENRLILDGMRWELELTFGNGDAPVKISGYNAYPEQFDALLELTGMEEKDEQDQD